MLSTSSNSETWSGWDHTNLAQRRRHYPTENIRKHVEKKIPSQTEQQGAGYILHAVSKRDKNEKNHKELLWTSHRFYSHVTTHRTFSKILQQNWRRTTLNLKLTAEDIQNRTT